VPLFGTDIYYCTNGIGIDRFLTEGSNFLGGASTFWLSNVQDTARIYKDFV